jgi:hypothetical protein
MVALPLATYRAMAGAALSDLEPGSPHAALYGAITSGTGQWRARLTTTEPMTRWLAWEELPTTIT